MTGSPISVLCPLHRRPPGRHPLARAVAATGLLLAMMLSGAVLAAQVPENTPPPVDPDVPDLPADSRNPGDYPPVATADPLPLLDKRLRAGPYVRSQTTGENARRLTPSDSFVVGAPPGAADSGYSTPPAESPDTIAVDRLETIDPSAIGTLDDANGGLGAALWEGTSRALVSALMPRLPDASRSPALKGLRHRLLLSAARPPLGDGSPGDLLAMRLARLDAAGDLQGLSALVRRIGPEVVDKAVMRMRLDVLLLAGDLPAACAEARAALQRENDPYWLKAAAFCRVLDGDGAGASLAVDLLREDGVDDAVFFTLMETLLAGQRGAEEPLAIATMARLAPLHLAMLRTAEQPIPLGAIVDAPPLLLQAIATAPGTPVNTRLQAAEAALASGAIDAATVAAIYGAVDYDEAARKMALERGNGDFADHPASLLYQAILAAPDMAGRLAGLDTVWRRARRDGTLPFAAGIYRQAIETIEPAPGLVADAAEICRALLLDGNIGRVIEWYAVVRRQAAGGDLDATRALLDIWPLIQIADGAQTLPFSPQILDLWWQGQQGETEAERKRRGTLLFSLLDAFDYDIPPALWIGLLQTSGAADDGSDAPATTVADYPLWRQMVLAGQGGRRGEAVLGALVLMGDKGPLAADPTVTGSVVAGLRAVGLADDARRLALEAAVAGGL